MTDEPLWIRKLVFSLWIALPVLFALVGLWLKQDVDSAIDVVKRYTRWFVLLPIAGWALNEVVRG